LTTEAMYRSRARAGVRTGRIRTWATASDGAYTGAQLVELPVRPPADRGGQLGIVDHDPTGRPAPR
jgi:hypothetical protein